MATTFTNGRFFDYRAIGLTPGAALYTYAAGTLTPLATYTDQGGGSSNANPVICDVNAGADVWLGTNSYKFRLYTDTIANGGVLIDEWDNISGPVTATDLSNSTSATLGSGMVGFASEGTGAVGRTVFSILRERKRLTNFLTTTEIDDILAGTAATDITAKFNLFLADCAGKLGILPWGSMRVNTGGTPVAISAGSLWLEGQGKSTRILSNSTTSDIFTVGDGSSEISGVQINDLAVWTISGITKGAGHAFNCRKMTDSKFDGVYAGSIDDYVAATNTHMLYDGVYFDQFSQVKYESGEVVCANEGIKARGQVTQAFGAELWLYGGLRIYKATNGVHLGGACGGVRFGDIDISECAVGVLVDQALQATYNREAFWSGECSIDTCTNGVKIDQSTASVARFIFNQTWVCGSTSHGVWVAAANGARVIADLHAYGNGGDGLRVDDATTYVKAKGEFDLNTGYGINPTVATSRLSVDADAFFLANTAGEFNSTSNSRPTVSMKTGTNKGILLNPDGALELTAATPYIDFKNADADDYDTRIALIGGTYLAVQGQPMALQNYTVATLPSAATMPYAKAFVTDANSTTFNATVAGGGANKVPCWSDGTNWKIG